ncbi:MAG: hypothetical protein QOG82_1710 [Actinomycetota bacterium]|nr:hypothetical protein [Actinomycetota bacterium]
MKQVASKIGQGMMATATKYFGIWTAACFAIALGLSLAFYEMSVAVWIGVGGFVIGILIDRVLAVRATKRRESAG